MSTPIAFVPQPKGAQGYVELAAPSATRKAAQGKVFEKEILKMGPLYHGNARGGRVDIDDTFVDTLIDNFNKGACDIVQMTIVDEKNRHTEDPLRNIGEVIGLTKRDGKVYAQVDVRDEAAVPKMGKTLLGGSAAMYLDYTDTDTQQKVGPTLTHLAVTNRPYVLGLETYKEVVALSADGSDDDDVIVLTDDKENNMTKEEFLALAKSDFGIDIESLQAIAAEHEQTVALSSSIQEALVGTGVLTLSNGAEATADDLITAVSETVKNNISLSARVDTLEADNKKSEATARVDSLIRQGRVLPAAKDAQVELLLSNPTLFESLLPEKALVAVDEETGTLPLSNQQDATILSEVDRIVEDARNSGVRI